ncbi:MAG: gliding motility lipoprotein GldH [Prolixibacteraceae bacterium]|jgi:gliding motility-associated lipoprotein GldH|nr:gliding motility lipoprotein GldH [Prolixibacteraceae bacterium]
MKFSKSLYQFCLVLVLFVMASCNSRTVYHENLATGNPDWHADSLLTFRFSIDDTVSLYNINISTRNLGAYPYSNIWFFINIVAPDSSMIADTVEYQLAEASGKLLGTGTGGVYSNQFSFRENVFFPVSGIYEISIQHGMRNESLKGISDVGLVIEKK